MRAGVERVTYTRHWIGDKDHLQRFFTCTEWSKPLQLLLAARATFAVAIDHSRQSIDNTIAVAKGLNGFGDGLCGIRSSLHNLAAKTLRSHEHKVRIRRRRSAFRSLKHTLAQHDVAFRRGRRLLGQHGTAECK